MLDRIRTAMVLGMRYVYLTRFSWIAGLVLLGMPPICLTVAPTLLANLFVLDHPLQLFHVSWITFWSAATVMETMRVTTLNADSRFDDYREAADRFRVAWGQPAEDTRREWYRRYDGWGTFIFGVVAALAVWTVMVDACATSIVADPTEAWSSLVAGQNDTLIREHAWTYAYRGLAVGGAVWMILSGLAIFLHDKSNQRWRRGQEPPFTPIYRRLRAVLGPGYFREDERCERIRLAPGHLSVVCYTLAFLCWYLIGYATATGARPMPTESSPYPALFYGLLTLLLLIYVLPGLAFFLDRYRIPTALTPVVAMMVFYQGFDTDHVYQLNPSPARIRAPATRQVTEVLDAWRIPKDREGKRTLIVVDASGGGIQASAWTAQVLTGLHEQYGDSVSQSIALISSVSGGSVGSMFYLANREEALRKVSEGETVLTPESIDRIRQLSRASGLEATTWGIAYADAMRALFPPLVDEKLDRGWAIERLWRQRLAESVSPRMADWRLSDIEQACRQRQLPIPVFNATFVETGNRLLISPVLSPPPLSGQLSGDGRYCGIEWMREYPESHAYVATAARLSATFPYVAPAARADSDVSEASRHHVVDGAYVDNEGAVTSVDWLSRMLDYYQSQGRLHERPFDRILLIRIQAFPQSGVKRNSVPGHQGWRAALTGPLDAMLQVRRASQTERGDLEVSLLTQATRARMSERRHRFEADIQSLQDRVASLKKQREMREQLLNDQRSAPGKTVSDLIRQQMEADDQIVRMNILIDGMQRHSSHLERMTVEAVTIDFHTSEPSSVPLSWKLTQRQQRNIDRAWSEVVSGGHPQKPLQVLDRYFYRDSRHLAAAGAPRAR